MGWWLGWAANALLCVGLYLNGRKERLGFWFILAGELSWVAVALGRGLWDMAFICAVFAAFALANWFRWGPDKESS
jgi:uncharacterized membrane protein